MELSAAVYDWRNFLRAYSGAMSRASFLFFARRVVLLAAWLVSVSGFCASGIDWPAERLLPAFSTPASTIDCIDITEASGAEQDLFVSLEGIINRRRPRLACVTERGDEGKFTWLKLHDLHYQILGGYKALAKYGGETTGLVVTDPQMLETLNLATTLAGLKNELICAPELLSKLTNAPYNFPIKDDLRGRFTDKYQMYQFLYDHYWPDCTHRVFTGLSRNVHGHLRDYVVAIKSAVVWLDPAKARDAEILSKFFGDLKPARTVYMGWWPDETAGLRFAGGFGVQVLASDFFMNGSLFSGVAEPVQLPQIPPAPPLENKIYVALFLSDGDNVQYVQHHMKHAWENAARGSVPIGWTISPLAVDFDPGMLNFYWRTATTNDCLVSGPSGAGYARLDFWKPGDLEAFTRVSDAYFRRSGLRVVTVWLRVTDAIGDSFATNCPTLLGLTCQEGKSSRSMYGDLPAIGFAKNYESNVAAVISGIADAAAKWGGKAPMFIAAQANGWDITPADCRTIANALDKSKFVVVRPDHLFELLRTAKAKDLKP